MTNKRCEQTLFDR